MAVQLPVLRQSAIAAASCLKRFHETQILGLEDDSDESRRGSAFHRIAFEEYVPRLVALQRAQDLEELREAFTRGIRATRCPSHLIDEVEDLVFFWGERFELNLGAFLLSEERQIADGLSWKPDLTFAHRNTPEGSILEIEDAKTYRMILTADAIRREFQPKFYIWRAMEAWPGFDVYRFTMTFVRYGVRVSLDFSRAELDALKLKVEATLQVIGDAITRDEWPAQPGEHCGFCRLACEVADDPRTLDRRILTAEEAEAVAGRILIMRRMLSADDAALRAWCVTEGPVLAGAMEFAHRETERQKWPVALVLDECKKAGVPPPLFRCGKTILRPLIATKKAKRAYPALVEALEGAAITIKGTTFGAKKRGDVAPDDDETTDDDQN